MPPVKSKPSAKKSAKKVAKSAAAAAPEPAPTPAIVNPIVETAPVAVAAAPAEANPADELTNAFGDFMTKMTALRQNMASLVTEFRTLQKRTERELKAAQKAGQKRKRKATNRAPSGFVKPTLISDQLADFLGKPKGSQLARTDVTREINAYIRAHKLQDPENGRKINPDTKLKKLLALKPSDELTYFNLQRYMSPHFQKAADAALAAAALAAAGGAPVASAV
jgi:chromatin remodeling complex protein RSC6